jgi:opacity protein-like surface antigen
MKNVTGFCAAALVAIAQTASADAGDVYVGVDAFSTDFSGPGPGGTSGFASGQRFGDSDTGYGLHLGYGFSDWFAVELGVADFGSATDTFKLKGDIVYIVKPNDTQNLKAKGLSLAGVFSQKMSEDWSVFGMLGVISMDYKSTLSGGFSEQSGSLLVRNSYDDQGLLFGVGIRYQLSDELSLRLALRRNDVGDFKLDTLGMSVEYQF